MSLRNFLGASQGVDPWDTQLPDVLRNKALFTQASIPMSATRWTFSVIFHVQLPV